MKHMRNAALAAIGVAALSVAGSPAIAGVFEIDTFTITKNGGKPGGFFADLFTDGNPPPNAPNFGSGSPASYNVNGGGVSEANGVVAMDNSLGIPTVFGGSAVRGNFVTLLSNAQEQVGSPFGNGMNESDNGLKLNSTFSVSGIYNLIIPTQNQEAYGIRLTDRGGPNNQAGNDTMELIFARNQQGDLVVSFRERDYVNLVVTPIASYTFGGMNYNLGANDAQIELILDHAVASSTAVSASFGLLDSNGTVLFSHTFQNTGNAFSDETWTRASFVSWTPTPEPATLALLGLGLAGIGAAGCRRKAC